MSKNEILTIIPARGGSKGLPRKNIKNLLGKPLIAYTIEAAKNCSVKSRVIVSTDDEEIAGIAKKFGAEIPCMRPKQLADDSSSTIDCVKHMLKFLKTTENYNPDYIMLLQCTSPLRSKENIEEAYLKLKNSNYDGVVSVCEYDHNPYWASVFDGERLKYFIDNGKKINRRQDLPEVYRINGAIYLVKTEALLRENTFEVNELLGYKMSRNSSIDIDNALDFKIAEFLLKEGEKICGK